MTVGDKGTTLTVQAPGFNLTGFTCTILAAPGDFTIPGAYPPPSALSLSPTTVVNQGSAVTYTTTGEFTAAGTWTTWIRGVNGGESLTVPPSLLYVYPAPP